MSLCPTKIFGPSFKHHFKTQFLKFKIFWTTFRNLSQNIHLFHKMWSLNVLYLPSYVFSFISILGIEAWPQMGIGKKARYYFLFVFLGSTALYDLLISTLGNYSKQIGYSIHYLLKTKKEDHMSPCNN